MSTNKGQTDLSRPVRDFVLPVETSLLAGQTIGQSLAAIRTRNIGHKVIYFYVVDDQNRLLGVIPTRKLLLGKPDESVTALMDSNPISITDTMTLEDAMEMFAMHRLLAFPVVDDDGKLVGHIDIDLYTDEAIDVSESHQLAEMFQLLGVSVQQARRSSPWAGYMLRMPWLLCNIAGGVACAIIAGLFQAVLAKVLLLAMFIPLVLTLSESISMQAMAMSLQQLRSMRAAWKILARRVSTEWKTAALVGISCGLLVALAATFFGQGAATAGIIGASIVASMVVAGTLGANMPFILHMLKLDPKVAAGPVVLMIVDVATTAIYLALANFLLL
ncbi:MAG: magnesium transporter [Planctomycetaceae bacterium]|nr:MAG: magnesium transporter [Planctomycetaceae bacterium]